eukprot:5727352-Prymnesium_polylepis.1
MFAPRTSNATSLATSAPPPAPPALPPGGCYPYFSHADLLLGGIGSLIMICAGASAAGRSPLYFYARVLAGFCVAGVGILAESPRVAPHLLPPLCGYMYYRPMIFYAEIALALTSSLLAFMTRAFVVQQYADRIATIEDALPARIMDGCIRLLRADWLLEQSADWVLLRRQDLPDAAYWSPDDALCLLTEGRVAALSY